MKPLLISYTDQYGGAARAAYRLHHALTLDGVDSKMKVRWKESDDWTVIGPAGRIKNVLGYIRPQLARHVFRFQKTENNNYHSGNFFPSNWAKEINTSTASVVNLHWVAGETMSIRDIGRITKPVVWTLHDMWPFSGAEHVSEYTGKARWKSLYTKDNHPISDTGADIDRYVWNRKLKHWNHRAHVVSPSQWLARAAKESYLFRHYEVSVIPNVLDTNVFKVLDKKYCRQILGLDLDKNIILFGGIGGTHSHNKGFDLLLAAMKSLEGALDKSETLCVVFGQGRPEHAPDFPFSVYWGGYIHDDLILTLFYNAADVMVVPSRQENLPQTATESFACGCPVVAFDCSGFKDVVDHRENGYLAEPYKTDDLALGISWVLGDSSRRTSLGKSARSKALRTWSPKIIIPQYLKLYKQFADN